MWWNPLVSHPCIRDFGDENAFADDIDLWDDTQGMRHLSGKSEGRAPGSPGIAPTWTSSAKDIVGCALGPSRVWFTLGFGIVNEVYYPRLDIPQIRS